MRIIERKLQDIIPYENNPRKNDEAVDKVAASIEQFGFNVPVLVDKDGVLVAGHTRLKAAERLGMEKVPCIIIDSLDDEKIRQFRILDNKTGELSSWDYDKLILELNAIPEIDMAAFEFGDFSGTAAIGTGDGVKEQNLDEGIEIDLDDFEDDAFDYECPYCGFRWNE